MYRAIGLSQRVMAGRLRFTFHVLAVSALSLLLASCVSGRAPSNFPDLTKLASQPDLPDPLKMFDGRRIEEPSQWFKERRPELKRLFTHYVHGPVPPDPDRIETKVIGSFPDFL